MATPGRNAMADFNLDSGLDNLVTGGPSLCSRRPTRTLAFVMSCNLKEPGSHLIQDLQTEKAVLRSSIREWVVSEALNALRIPTTRALSLTLLPKSQVVRERIEPGAIVLRFAQSWIRLGNFDILRARQDRPLIRKLATYVAEDVFGGWDKLPGRLQNPEKPSETPIPRRGLPGSELEGPEDAVENRFNRLFREVVRRNALVVAHWQAYGFMNGVLVSEHV